MADYIVGDIQGCYKELCLLLEKIEFDKKKDTLWSVGDLVSRGKDSLNTLIFLKGLGKAFQTVLGNHDLHFLAIIAGCQKPKKHEYLDALLSYKDIDVFVDWLRQYPLALAIPNTDIILSHAGIHPFWNETVLFKRVKLFSELLLSKNWSYFVCNMYKDIARDNGVLNELEYHIFTVNVLTRMRYLTLSGDLDFSVKDNPMSFRHENLLPWFQFNSAFFKKNRLVFGHWSTLKGVTHVKNKICLDTGCCWGERLTTLRVNDNKMFYINAQE